MPKTDEIVEIRNPRQIPNYDNMIEDLRAIVVETETNARETVIVGYHELGRQIIDYHLDKPEFLQQVAQDIKKSKRTLYQILQFVKKWPTLQEFYDAVKEGKMASWHLVCNRYLAGKKEEPELYYISCETLASYLKENADFVSSKVVFTKTGVTLRISKEQIEGFVEGVKHD
jgi:hypothetical protein